MLGRYPEPGFTAPRALFSDPLAAQIFLRLRLPRVLLSVFLGMSLATSGAVFQLIFSNPLVEPGFLGVTQGAAFGAVAAILLFGGSLPAIQASSALCGILGLALAYWLARRIRFGGWILRLILSGLAVSALFTAGIGIIKYTADPLTQLPEITFWLLGGLSHVSWGELLSVLPAVTAGLLLLLLFRWRVNLLTLSDETAFALGTPPERIRLVLIVAATIAVAAVISVSGIVLWLGLIVPHLARRIFGADGRYSIPGALLIGGGFGLLCDTLARMLLPGEIPLGIMSSLLGAILFALILTRRGFRP
ncbi:MAG: iron ABC transporter permease [Spirochaetales bacterium]|nr:iron ABC transporter permease [Spirochaetales bacterium]